MMHTHRLWFTGESFWAKPPGNDLNEIQIGPFWAYGLNCRDVVHATANAPDLIPEIHLLYVVAAIKPSAYFSFNDLSEDEHSLELTIWSRGALARNGFIAVFTPEFVIMLTLCTTASRAS